MRFFKRLAAAAPLALAVASFAATDGEAGSGNWALDQVRAWEASMIERVLGEAEAEAFLANPEIVGGTQAPSGRWPGQVALLYASESDNFQAQYCGGALINARFVLTAAHCVDFLSGPAEVEVLTGTQSLDSGGTRRAVTSYTIHPNWNDKTSDYDVAVIELATSATGLTVNKVIKPGQARRLTRQGKPAIVTGWGKTKSSGNAFPTDLRQVKVPFVSRATCNKRQSYNGDVTARMICAGYRNGGKDACQGDSGGPLVVKRKRRLQAGIVSWGIGCGKRNYYGVYTNLAVLRNWVLNVVGP